MEYVNTVLVDLAAAGVDEASPGGLLAELDGHRDFLERQPGFHGMQVTRSTGPGGQVQLLVETRWLDSGSLAAYEAGDADVVSIINRHRDVIVPDTLRVSSAEASAAASPAPAPDVGERLLLPILVPLGVFLFGVLVVYGLSRIYL